MLRVDDDLACEGVPDLWLPMEGEEEEEGVVERSQPISSYIRHSPLCGPYCPVTIIDDNWLYPGQVRRRRSGYSVDDGRGAVRYAYRRRCQRRWTPPLSGSA